MKFKQVPFLLKIADLPPVNNLSKRINYCQNVWHFGIVYSHRYKNKILLQLKGVDMSWDDQMAVHTKDEWFQWLSKLQKLADKHFCQCYFKTDVLVILIQLYMNMDFLSYF